ncbi:DUF1853 family protein [Vibrio natriegens]|uniref:Type II citrate synthase n=1 Tax=Vibrio natriegens NBRC 15636 = ATCC 14048 = DSM 759 TaxID=1219067 RepID=A0AAN0Y0U5_VIBNA|nr:DUF1853 family protein [Vibrio natriegens]ALR16171.1 type II citrate synthase [Vibrio natriegens NBRC 15636 = ATCC 14048 = DSM 759]ANQ11967.1 type II citrate synthase [Vibrio natriegens NBRC 15636 = ATCC 14048 = DSM 759]EPM41252.1 type II citrate synthase [Vibrio natriegens NBRC 15636 = ATCC 14048 = DSM 759]MDX6026319.1 DUF1853 family protein [Vibrio natriegens NBRC 15636 = ATCC 14048 = DSM 759]UUI12425.1 DUF1853 family protein [Vibrio natriegens]
MNQLQRFYDWIATSPPLFQLRPPFATLEDLSVAPLCESEQYSGNPRLGFLYQHLCTAVLSHSERYQVVAEEIQLNDHTGRTIGAVDLVLQNTESGQLEHWEVAIKFYLLHQGVWYGPNAHDQLHKKLDRMLTHQLKMSERPEFQQILPLDTPPKERLLMQGRLYINPFSSETTPTECLGYELNASQISGYWCYQSQWDLIPKPLYHLSKPCWAMGTDDFSHPIEKPSGRFEHAQTEDGEFWFIVPDHWPN